MTKRAVLDVQLIGYTTFTPPIDRETNKPLFEPDDYNVINADGPDTPFYDGSGLAEFAGRSCYQSFHKPNPATATNRGYLTHILESGHLSVLEHATATFYIQGVSRSLTHELIRHRHLSPSQLSQRFVDESGLTIVIPPAVEDAINYESSGPEEAKRRLDDFAQFEFDIASTRYLSMIQQLQRSNAEKLTRKQLREAARAVLPNETETKIVLTGNYRAWITFLQQRDSPAADAEIARLAGVIRSHLAELAPAVFDNEARKYWTVGERA